MPWLTCRGFVVKSPEKLSESMQSLTESDPVRQSDWLVQDGGILIEIGHCEC